MRMTSPHNIWRVAPLVLLGILGACSEDDDPAPPTPAATIVVSTPSATAAPPTATPTTVLAATATTTLTPSPSVTPTATRSAAELAAAGATAFFDTLMGIAERDAEAIDLLGAAVALNANDGRSFFLLGMTHMLRVGRTLPDWHQPTTVAQAEVVLAQAALDTAVPLLPDDKRIPGFRAAATYTNGFIHNDPDRIALGLQQLRDAIALFPEFNTFDFIGVVAPALAPSDPLFQEAVGYVADAVNNGCSPFTNPEICGNNGKAPHNIEGSLVLFGDMFAKAGDLTLARFWYTQSLQYPDAPTWRFRSIADNRIATVEQRVALYQDADPTNDPPLLGNGPEACAVCHYR